MTPAFHLSIPVIPAKAGTQIEPRGWWVGNPLSPSNPRLSHAIWVPASAGMTGSL